VLQLTGTTLLIAQDGFGSSTSTVTRFISSTGHTATVGLPASYGVAVSDASWLTAQTDASNGLLTYSASFAPVGIARVGNITWGGSTLTIIQPAAVFDPASGRWHDEAAPCEVNCDSEWIDYEDFWYFDGPRETKLRPGKIVNLSAYASTNQIAFDLVGDNRESSNVEVRLYTSNGTMALLPRFSSSPGHVQIPFPGLAQWDFVKVIWFYDPAVPACHDGSPESNGAACAVAPVTQAQLAPSVSVRCRTVGGSELAEQFGALHCYVVTSNAGIVMTAEGGELAGRPIGVLVTNVYPGNTSAYNSPLDPEFGPAGNRTAADVNCVLSTFTYINTLRLPYFFLGPNSNGTLNTVMNLCGMPVNLPPQAIGKDVPIGLWR
jgi:hypothetical protein